MIEEIQEKVPTEIEFKEMIERMKVYAYQKDSDYLIPILGEKQAKKCKILNKLDLIVISSENWAIKRCFKNITK